MFGDPEWYVIRTKQYKERFVAHSLQTIVDDIYLPLLRSKRRALGRFIERTEALFPCYIFARFRLIKSHYRLTRTPGVLGMIYVGDEPAAVDESIVQQIRSREKDGLIVLPVQRFQPAEAVTITEGALQGIDAVFERYLSGAERVAVLLNTIGRATVRVILRTNDILPNTSLGIASPSGG